MIKCASETLAAVFRRFGYLRNLNFVLPLDDKLYVGWPYVLREAFYRTNKTSGFNILVDHAVYNREALSKTMPEDTVYITSIRHPYSQFKSMMRYYNLAKIVGLPANNTDPVKTYLNNIKEYEAKYKSPESAKLRHCIPDNMSLAQNQMAFNLGFPLGFPTGTPDLSHNTTFVRQWLHSIEDNFKLIMLVEYFDESLVLLKRLMCWKTKDILYFTKNEASYTYKFEINYQKNLDIYKNFSNVDFMLYEHFEYVFWKKVSQEGRGFIEEVQHFKRIRSNIIKFCDKVKQPGKSITIEGTGWSEMFTVDFDYCRLLRERLVDELKKYYDEQPVEVAQPNNTVFFCWNSVEIYLYYTLITIAY